MTEITANPRRGRKIDERPPDAGSLGAICENFIDEAHQAGLDFGSDHKDLVTTFIAALATKPFVIFSGLSGAGKTRLATAFGQWFGKEHLLLQPVRPDWTSPEMVLGFENLSSESSESRYSWSVPRTLEFVLGAARDPDQPYLLILDEMNLSHVEQYFADVLSGMESNQAIVPNLIHDGSGWRLPLREVKYIPWPKNLFLVGTVNLDETTYLFSPKVLDRATNIEFRVLPGSLQNEYSREEALARGDQELHEAFLKRSLNEEPAWEQRSQLGHSLAHLHRLLYEHDAEFGHRVYRESLRFGSMLADAGIRSHKKALDYVLLYKVLPKLDNVTDDVDLLHALAAFALYGSGRAGTVDPLLSQETMPVLTQSFSKIRRMTRRLQPKSTNKGSRNSTD